jgi:biopolymer transport protein ExbD
MKIKSNQTAKPTFELSSMTDLVFLLLIFFMLVATMIVPNVNALKLVLPNSNTAGKVKDLTISVAINEKQEYFIDGKQVGIDALKPTLIAALANKPNPTIILHTDYSVPISDVVSVMDVANQMKVKLVLATSPEK